MRARICIITLLLLALLVSMRGQVVPAGAGTTVQKLPECATMDCVHGCCGSMPCCVRGDQEKSKPSVPTPTTPPQRTGPDLAVLAFFVGDFQYASQPIAAKRAAARDLARPQAPPRRAALCVFLI